MEMIRAGQTLSTLADMSDSLKEIYKSDLRSGDCLIVQTRNSLYKMEVIGDGWVEITGGWFDRKGKSPMRVRINGCTWGGSAIKPKVAAACGLCLEFGNRVVTSPVQRVLLISHGDWN
jgi:hypothetical protein